MRYISTTACTYLIQFYFSKLTLFHIKDFPVVFFVCNVAGSGGLELQGTPKIWRLYASRKRVVKRGDEVAVAVGVTELPNV